MSGVQVNAYATSSPCQESSRRDVKRRGSNRPTPPSSPLWFLNDTIEQYICNSSSFDRVIDTLLFVPTFREHSTSLVQGEREWLDWNAECHKHVENAGKDTIQVSEERTIPWLTLTFFSWLHLHRWWCTRKRGTPILYYSTCATRTAYIRIKDNSRAAPGNHRNRDYCRNIVPERPSAGLRHSFELRILPSFQHFDPKNIQRSAHSTNM